MTNPNNKTADEIVAALYQTADFFHSMDIDDTNSFRFTQWAVTLDVIERVLGLDENSLMDAHSADCPHNFTY